MSNLCWPTTVASCSVILESDPQQVVHRVALRVSFPLLGAHSKLHNALMFGCISCKHGVIVPAGGWCAFDRADGNPGEKNIPRSAIKFKSSISLLTVKTHRHRTDDYKDIVRASFFPPCLLCHPPLACHLLHCLRCMTVSTIANYSVVRW